MRAQRSGAVVKWTNSLVLAGFAAMALTACGEDGSPDAEGAGDEAVAERGLKERDESPETAGEEGVEEPSRTERGQAADTDRRADRGSGEASPTEQVAPSEDEAPAREADEPSPTIAAGTVLTLEVPETISTRTHETGDAVTLRLTEGVAGSEGAVVPAGAEVQGYVAEAARSTDAEEEAVLSVHIESVRVSGTDRALSGEIQGADLEAASGDSRRRSAAKVATGTAVGAVTGRILGGDRRSAAAGAAAGAVAGTGVALVTRDGHAELPEGALVTYQLTEPLILR